MRRLALLCLLLGLFAILPTGAYAQQCDSASLVDEMEAFAEQLENAADDEATLAILAEITTWYETTNDTCQEQMLEALAETESSPAYSFNNLNDGLHTVIGPIAIEDGFYRLRTASTNTLTFTVDARDGFCTVHNTGYPQMEPAIRSFAEVGHAPEYLLETHGCEALISIGGDYGVWQLDLYPLNLEQPYSVQETYSSEIEGRSPVIGPIAFEDGTYAIRITSESEPSIYLTAISGSCETGQNGRLFPSANGSTTVLVRTEGCVAFMTVDDLAGEWELQVTLRNQPK
jgi:hypothetical protein